MSQDALVNSFNRAQSQLVIQTSDLPLGTLASMVEEGSIDLQPGFQRRERWNVNKQSALIESFLLNVPVPPIYLAEEDNGTYLAIDGKQRLKAITDFFYGRFTLKGLDRLNEAEGIGFSDLPSEIANSFRLRPSFRVVTLLKQSDHLLKFEVFLRLNRGGESLNAQEIRNVAFNGPMNAAIYELSESIFLRRQLKIDGPSSAAYRDMSDAEYVLRFLALSDRYDEFKGSLSYEMDDFMERHRNAPDRTITIFVNTFNSTLKRCERIWEDNAFRRPVENGWRDQTLAGMYDAQMLAVNFISEHQYRRCLDNQNDIIVGTRRLFDDHQFETAVRTGTNTPARIQYRVTRMRELLESI